MLKLCDLNLSKLANKKENDKFLRNQLENTCDS